MLEFTGKDMLKIDIANCFGLDKTSWVDRIIWTEVNRDNLENLTENASEPLLFLKAVKALRKTENKEPTGHNMFLDATASGLQIMAILSGCKLTAKHVNLINTGQREDVYAAIAFAMNKLLPSEEHITRDDIKYPLMTHYYNKARQDDLSEKQQVAFYQAIAEEFPGPESIKNIINMFWNYEGTHHTWTLPDGHIAHVPVTEMITARIEVDELNHTTFSYRFEAVKPSEKITSLVPNIIHSIDGYIAREMVRRANEQGYQLAHIHDAFCTHPNHMQKARENYRNILAEIASSSLLENILTEIAGQPVKLTKDSEDLAGFILDSEYALS